MATTDMRHKPTRQQVRALLTARAARGDQGARFVLAAERGQAERQALAMNPGNWPALWRAAKRQADGGC